VPFKRLDGSGIALELGDHLRLCSPLVHNQLGLLRAHHDVAVFWHVEHILDEVFLRPEDVLEGEVVHAVVQFVEGGLL